MEELKEREQELNDEIENVEKVMTVYTAHIAKWLGVIESYPRSVKDFMNEYTAGTNRLHELQCTEMRLRQELEELMELIEEVKELEEMGTEEDEIEVVEEEVATLLVHLPNNQHTTIRVEEGVTLRQALATSMERRHLDVKDCAAFIKQKNMFTISWDAQIATLQCKEIFVETMEQAPVPVLFKHNFLSNTVTVGICNYCRSTVLYGYICTECNRRYHPKCIYHAPTLCEHVKNRRAYYERLLACNKMTGLVQVPPRPVPVPSVSRKREKLEWRERNLYVHMADKSTQVYALDLYTAEGKLDWKRVRRYRKLVKRMKKGEVNPEVDSIFSGEDIVFVEARADEIEIGEEVDAGTFGKVFHAEWHGSVAVKTLKTEKPTPEQVQNFKHEVNILRELTHPNVLALMGVICKPFLAIVTQWCDTTLYERLYESEEKLAMCVITIILRQLARGLGYLHSQGVIHRDLKSKNIFLHRGLHTKIGDFGLALVLRDEVKEKKETWLERVERLKKILYWREYEKEKKKKEKDTKREEELRRHERLLAGSVPWMAPEVLRMKFDENPYSFASDTYSYGIVMYELFTQVFPYGPKTDKLFILYNVGRGALHPDLTLLRRDIPKDLRNLMEECISYDKEMRPLTDEIIKRTNEAYYYIPKIKRTTSLPAYLDVLPDTYYERALDNQYYIFSDSDSFVELSDSENSSLIKFIDDDDTDTLSPHTVSASLIDQLAKEGEEEEKSVLS
ncbi:PREDICTED: serine/threonine-protein kinase A-Raf-like [Vollenhovia emeryi]|uniref:serine/threonine-protein kinase A-Raf-like n=1 Tax=Vollenhovia emeryi TaxID=411798 RepID=UPI0005F51DC7|nr:PREDICTED: serine/threonine-protein kinase A-Raf-like [Vollenhovia emeryi]